MRREIGLVKYVLFISHHKYIFKNKGIFNIEIHLPFLTNILLNYICYKFYIKEI